MHYKMATKNGITTGLLSVAIVIILSEVNFVRSEETEISFEDPNVSAARVHRRMAPIAINSTTDATKMASTSRSWISSSSTIFPPTTSTPVNASRHCWHYYEYCRNIFLNVSQASLHGKPIRLRGIKVNSTSRPEAIVDENYGKTRCYCDDRCDLYGDCCFDKVGNGVMALTSDLPDDPTVEYESTSDGMATALTVTGNRWECHHIPISLEGDRRETLNVYMVSACPVEWEDEHVLDRCLRRNTRNYRYDYTLDLPAYSVVTNTTYVNIYCAICHNDQNIRRWKLRILCPMPWPNCTKDTANWQYMQREKRWRYRSLNVTYDLEVDATDAADYYRRYATRRCRDDVISACADSWRPRDGAVRRLCDSYALYVKSDNHIYKNEYCAICNRASTLNLQCPAIVRVVEEKFAGPVKRPPGVSYSLLLDFWSGDGSSRVGESHRCGTHGEHICTFGEFCDPLHQRCRSYTCGRKYRMDDEGQCVAVDIEETSFTTNSGNTSMDELEGTGGGVTLPTLERDCAKAFVHLDHFVWVAGGGGAVYINVTDRIYNVSQYELVNVTTILVCVDDAYLHAWRFSTAQSVLSTVLVTFSLVCLALHIVIHWATPQLLNLPGKNLVCLSCSLLVAQLCFEYGVTRENVPALCTAVALAVHFGFLASFFWMNVMAIDVCCTFSNKQIRSGSTGLFRKYSLYAWLNPGAVVGLAWLNDAVSYLPDYRPDYAQPLCWINNRQALLLYFAGPLALLLLVNVILFLMTVFGILRTMRATRAARHHSSARGSGIANDTIRILLYAKLALIMGLTWVFGFVAAMAEDVEFYWYVFIVFNALQGTFIFVAFSCKRQVVRAFGERLGSTLRRVRGGAYGSVRQSSAVTKSTVLTSNINREQESTTSVLNTPKTGGHVYSIKFTPENINRLSA